MAETEMETDLPERSKWKKPTKEDGRLTPRTAPLATMTDFLKKYSRQVWGNGIFNGIGLYLH